MSAARKLGQVPPIQVEVSEQTKARGTEYCVGLANSLPPNQVLRLATELGYAHVIQKDGLEYAKELATAEALIAHPAGFFVNPVDAVFPYDQRLGPSQTLLGDRLFTSSSQKREVLDSFTGSMGARGYSPTLVDDITLVADEMFTNAVFNAPFVDKKTHANANVSRQNTEVTFDNNKPGRMMMAADQSRIMVACLDPYGSLSLTAYLGKIKATYERGTAATMNFGSGGAGIGSYIIFNTCASLFVGVEQGRATVVACLLPLKLSNRKRALLPKHLHWIQL